MPEKPDSVTELIHAHGAGQEGALNKLVEQVYDDLREIAHIQIARLRSSRTLNTTALINELYCKLANHGLNRWKNRNHFYAACATTMRHLLVDAARHRLREKRGGGDSLLTFDEGCVASRSDPEWILELDELMNSLARHDPRLVSVFECRYFGGFTTRETARILSLSERTVERDWARARGWLQSAMGKESERPCG